MLSTPHIQVGREVYMQSFIFTLARHFSNLLLFSSLKASFAYLLVKVSMWFLSKQASICSWFILIIFLLDDDDNELFLWHVDGQKRLSLFPAGTVVRNPHHYESRIHHKQDMNMSRTWVQTLMNEVAQ